MAFTGTLASMTHAQAAELAREHGATATEHVSRQTTMLVVGEEGWPLEPDGQPSVKLREAERRRQEGIEIRIVSESEWLSFVGLDGHRVGDVGVVVGIPTAGRGADRIHPVVVLLGLLVVGRVVVVRDLAQLGVAGVQQPLELAPQRGEMGLHVVVHVRGADEDAVGADELAWMPCDLPHRLLARVVDDHRRGELGLEEEVEDGLHRIAIPFRDRAAGDHDVLGAERAELVLPARQTLRDVVGDSPSRFRVARPRERRP